MCSCFDYLLAVEAPDADRRPGQERRGRAVEAHIITVFEGKDELENVLGFLEACKKRHPDAAIKATLIDAGAYEICADITRRADPFYPVPGTDDQKSS